MPRYTRPNDPEKKVLLIKALEGSLGIISTACKKVGISTQTYYNWLESDPEFRKKVDEVNELQVDFVETQLLKNISRHDTAAIIFYMKHKGKKRGYCEKETEQTENINLTVSYKE